MSKSMILESEKSKFLHILKECKQRRVKSFTQQEICTHLNVSRKKLVDFENGRIFDFWLLCRYANINFYDIEIQLFELKINNS